MSKGGGNWTPERVTKLLELEAQGFSYAEIAERLGGVSRSACIGKSLRVRETAQARGVLAETVAANAKPQPQNQRQQRTPEEKAQLIENIRAAAAEQLTQEEAAERLGLTPANLRYHAGEHHISFNGRSRNGRKRAAVESSPSADAAAAYHGKVAREHDPMKGYIPRSGVKYAEIVHRVALRSKTVRGCSCRPCKHLAEPGSMWCAEHERWAQSLRETAA